MNQRGMKMTADDFRKKSRRAMSNKNTRPVKVGTFNVTSHAQNQMIVRDIPNEAMIRNLCRKPAARICSHWFPMRTASSSLSL